MSDASDSMAIQRRPSQCQDQRIMNKAHDRQAAAQRSRSPVNTLAAGLIAFISAIAPMLSAHAQTWPSRPIHLVVPYPAGGSADILARAAGQKLTGLLGQPWIIENRAGAGTAIGTLAVAQASPDGYTLLLGTVSSHAINPALKSRIGYDPVRDFRAIAGLASMPFALLAHPSVPAHSVAELIALARARPGVLTYASAGAGTSNHLACELFASMAGIQLVHVPYKGSAPALADLISGQVNLMFDLVLTAAPQVRSGAVRALAVSGHARSTNLPAVPTFAESGIPGYEVSAWFGLFGPSGIPAATVARLHEVVTQILAMPDFHERLASQGADPMSGSSAQFALMVRTELDRWTQVVRSAGIQDE